MCWPSTDGGLVVVVIRQAQAHHGQLVDDFLQGLAAQVADLHHIVLGLGNQVGDGVDVGALEAVEASDRQIQLLDGHLQHLVADVGRFLHHRGLVAHGLAEICKEHKVVAEDAGARDTASRAAMVPSVQTSRVSLS